MYRFYVEPNQIGEININITGSDVNHIKNVLRMTPGDKIIICNGQGKDFYCIIKDESGSQITTEIQEVIDTDTELGGKLYLFQGIPKKDKMELIIQKAVELGVYEIIPVMTKRTVVKLEDKRKELKKLERWQSISASAAKQSGRGIIPKVTDTFTMKEAVSYAKNLDCKVIPYEKADDITNTRKIIESIKSNHSVGIFIGPEGGFEEQEIEQARNAGIIPITLGRRILRTETAGLAVLAMLMLQLESAR
ncbi:16S rRNA (uracil(1498)-N(3))-methyltransferase [Anaerocolumna sp. MB42-C2]|uniref:16S rRNA (uracil(1498)-N(3))-methyltransferase n=1 Tax=Anaerocolumna sp. MB42-C2 TaxID=3070997 RepID=UPI0027E1CEDE|nr:16S rRNA (uracil(1498)-N(3))-methyltransferase [Anaerocolumna sp. MB42-C2]WMJ88617.1 16S rRNA (uracil(1498)-N(3))-methyltransferase [Anaerocolumna sp. MB42-C2]